MKITPLLLKSDCKAEFSRQMFTDINLDKLISEASVKILQSPCGKDEILLRQEFFTVLNNSEKYKCGINREYRTFERIMREALISTFASTLRYFSKKSTSR